MSIAEMAVNGVENVRGFGQCAVMNRFWICAWIVAAGLWLAGCNKPATATTTNASVGIDPIHGHLLAAQPRLPTVKLWLGDRELTTEVARRPVEIATGMMFRTNMTDSEGMLFVFPGTDTRSFYMRNCSVALSAAYIDPSGTILEIIKLEPFNETAVPSASASVQFVLEVPQGWFDRYNVRTGAVIRSEAGDLQRTFFQRR